MFATPKRPQLTPDQARDLDDIFFGSRPFEYFAARTASLISTTDHNKANVSHGLGASFSAALGVADVRGVLSFDASDHELRVATESFAMRHHAAEALVRLYDALTTGSSTGGSAPSTWVSIVDGPTRTVKLVERSSLYLNSRAGRDSFWSLVLPSEVVTGTEPSNQINIALNVMGAWLQHAMDLLVRDDIDVNAAHNKVKHGLAIRARDDVRLTFTSQAPNSDGTLPVSALSGANAVDVFDSVTLDYLAHPPAEKGARKHGLEISRLALAPEKLLAEAWMMATTHAAMFHIAAAQHFKTVVADRPHSRPTPWRIGCRNALPCHHSAGRRRTRTHRRDWAP